MDEDEEQAGSVEPQRHDRWSVLILGLNWTAGVAALTAATLQNYTIMAAEHGYQKQYDRRFNEIARRM